MHYYMELASNEWESGILPDVPSSFVMQQIALSIVDNGRGFDSTADISGKSLGLYGMRERARAIGGDLQIDSGEAGTSVQLTLSL